MLVIRVAAPLALWVLASSSNALGAPPTKEACVAANESAQDLRQAGKLREAREKLLLCVSDACPGPVREDCAQRLNDVNAAMPTLVFEVKDSSGNDVGAARVTMDGKPLVEKVTGSAVPIDPGQHHFIFDDAGGGAHAEQTVVVREGDHERHIRVVLEAITGVPAAPPSAPAETPEASESPTKGDTQRTLGLVVGGAGVVGLVIGGIFGLVSKSTYDHAFTVECSGNANDCRPSGVQDGQTAHSQAMVSTVGFIAGSVLLAGGAVLYFTAPRVGAVGIAPAIGSNGAGVTLGGPW
jgi:hypothetical protein